MIRVTVELLPRGSEQHKRTLGVATITNDGTGTNEVGNYDVKLSKFGDKGTWKRGRVEGFKRLKLGPWDLLFLALYPIVKDRVKRT